MNTMLRTLQMGNEVDEIPGSEELKAIIILLGGRLM